MSSELKSSQESHAEEVSWSNLLLDENLTAYDEFDLSMLESLSEILDSSILDCSEELASLIGTDSESLCKTITSDNTEPFEPFEQSFEKSRKKTSKRKRVSNNESKSDESHSLITDAASIENNWIEWKTFIYPSCSRNVHNKIKFFVKYLELANSSDHNGMNQAISEHLHADCSYILPTTMFPIPAMPAFFQIFLKAAQSCPDIIYVPTSASIVSNNSFIMKVRGAATLVHRKYNDKLFQTEGRLFSQDFDMSSPTAKYINHYKKLELKAKTENLSLQAFFHFSIFVKLDSLDATGAIILRSDNNPLGPDCNLSISCIKTWWKIVHMKLSDI